MGNLCTKIFHANSDAETNEYASRLIGNALTYLSNIGEQHRAFSLEATHSQGMNSQFLPQVQPREFTTLKTGGSNNDFEVHGILAVSGKEWSNKKNYLRISFAQKFDI